VVELLPAAEPVRVAPRHERPRLRYAPINSIDLLAPLAMLACSCTLTRLLFRFLEGAYYHELFIRHRPDLHSFMRRVGKPHLMDRRKHKLAEGDDPNFYGMSRVPEVPPPPPTESTVTTTTTTTTTAAAAATASTSSRQGSAPPLKSSDPESAPASSSESESGKEKEEEGPQ
jgi:hypothetical protein